MICSFFFFSFSRVVSRKFCRKGTTKKLHDKDFAELSCELSGLVKLLVALREISVLKAGVPERLQMPRAPLTGIGESQTDEVSGKGALVLNIRGQSAQASSSKPANRTLELGAPSTKAYMQVVTTQQVSVLFIYFFFFFFFLLLLLLLLLLFLLLNCCSLFVGHWLLVAVCLSVCLLLCLSVLFPISLFLSLYLFALG